ncbi:MAG TPA: GGDEF domain-containing protein [Candidatus Omnitrophota bacterium]|nr:GGDEF domain-containing protein [Candidatus Omnitrophota bacterium]
MFKVNKLIFFVVNILLIVASIGLRVVPRGDEYIILFVIPLLFIISPYVLGVRQTIFMISINAVFFVSGVFFRILEVEDVIMLTTLLVVCAGVSRTLMTLGREFDIYNRSKIIDEERKYNGIVKELEGVEREGRVVEKELVRISRLYEITKQLGSVLKFGDLLDALLDFLENNFRFETAHLLVFSKGEFTHGVSRSVSLGKDSPGAQQAKIEYKALVEYMKERDFKPFYLEREEAKEFFEKVSIKSDTFFAFPLFVEHISAILALEGANKVGFSRFGIVVPQIALELRKVELYEQVEKLSIIDGLTGIYLRRYLIDRLEEEVDRARRLNLTFSVGMIDIDHFKKINDTYGHLVGDAVLKEIAERLKLSVREVDMVARYGGEEFCVVLPETTSDLARTVAERLRKSVESGVVKAFDEKIKVSVSIGVATYPADGNSASVLIDSADNALYRAKRKGRNRVCLAGSKE